MSKWTEDEVKFLEEHYGKTTAEKIAGLLGRSTTSVIKKANSLYLTGMPNKKRDKSPFWKGCGEISSIFFNKFKRKAKQKNRKFQITIEQGWELFLKQNKKCTLTGLDLTFPTSSKFRYDGTASLDRIDNQKDYTIDNVQWVHKDINMMKYTMDQDYFIKLCKYVATHNWYNI